MRERSLEDRQWDQVGLHEDLGSSSIYSISSILAFRNLSVFRANEEYQVALKLQKELNIKHKKPLEIPNIINTNPFFFNVETSILLNIIGINKLVFDSIELLFAYPAAAIVSRFHRARKNYKAGKGSFWAYLGMGILNVLIAGAFFRVANLISGIGEIVTGIFSLFPGSGASIENSCFMILDGLKKVAIEAVILGITAAVGVFTGGIGHAFISVFSSLGIYTNTIAPAVVATAVAVSAAIMSGLNLLYRGIKRCFMSDNIVTKRRHSANGPSVDKVVEHDNSNKHHKVKPAQNMVSLIFKCLRAGNAEGLEVTSSSTVASITQREATAKDKDIVVINSSTVPSIDQSEVTLYLEDFEVSCAQDKSKSAVSALDQVNGQDKTPLDIKNTKGLSIFDNSHQANELKREAFARVSGSNIAPLYVGLSILGNSTSAREIVSGYSQGRGRRLSLLNLSQSTELGSQQSYNNISRVSKCAG